MADGYLKSPVTRATTNKGWTHFYYMQNLAVNVPDTIYFIQIGLEGFFIYLSCLNG